MHPIGVLACAERVGCGRLPGMTTEDPGPIVQRLLLGADLRDAREAAGLSTADATKALGWYAGKLSKVEQGDKGITNEDLARAVEMYGISSERARTLRDLATDARRRLPPSRVPEWATKYVNLERAAVSIRMFYPDTFPGAVQTVEYARAILSASVVVARADVDRMADDRARRSERLKVASDTRVWLVVGEEAIRRTIGGPEVMRGQLQLIREIAQLPNVTVQAIPIAGGPHSAHNIAFALVHLRESQPGLVYVEGLTGSDYLGREHTRAYTLAFDTLIAAAMSPTDTLGLIDRQLS